MKIDVPFLELIRYALAPVEHYKELNFDPEQVSEKHWKELVHMSHTQLASSYVYGRLKEKDVLHLLPVEERDCLEASNYFARERYKKITKQLVEIQTAFLAKGLNPIYLKGAALLINQVYPNPWERMFSDFDIFFREEEFEEAINTLQEIGYEFEISVPRPLVTILDQHQAPIMLNNKKAAHIELHKHPVHQYLDKFLLTSKFLTKNTKNVIRESLEFLTPSTDFMELHCFYHSQIANKGYIFRTIDIRAFTDYNYLIRNRNHNSCSSFLCNNESANLHHEIIFFRKSWSYFFLKNNSRNTYTTKEVDNINEPYPDEKSNLIRTLLSLKQYLTIRFIVVKNGKFTEYSKNLATLNPNTPNHRSLINALIDRHKLTEAFNDLKKILTLRSGP